MNVRGMHRVRWIRGEEPEMQCAYCFDFWPLTGQFWDPTRGIQKCATCQREERAERWKRSLRRRDANNPDIARAYDADHYRRTRSTLARLRRAA